MKILTLEEEKKLSNNELLAYYKELQSFLLKMPYSKNLSPGSLTICPKINNQVKKILKTFCGYKIETIGYENIKGITGIYAHTHQSKSDHINCVATNPNHTIILNSSVLSNFYKSVINFNGVYYVDKRNKASRNQAKLEMIKLLLENHSITIFPESTWNCSPNKLHLPMRFGLIDISKKSQKPIIPVVQEYIYDEKKQDGKERIKKAYIVYGNPIYVKYNDNLIEKLEEYSTAIATIRWNLIEQKGIFNRNNISNQQYINYMNGIKRNLRNAHIDINVEREGIYTSNDEFYLFHHINDVDYDKNGKLKETKYVRKLINLYNNNCYK